MYDILVIGGGPAGVTAALRACELGKRVALVERGRLGGTCTNDGCVPTRVLAHAARLTREARQYEEYGLEGPAPVVNFARVLAQTQRIVFRLHEKKQLQGHLEAAGATVFTEVGPARFVDPHTISLADGTRLSAEKLIVCAGGHARRLDFPGSEHALTHSDVWSLKQLPRSIVIVGGSATGCQLASIFAAFGSEVWILEIGPRLLGLEDVLVSQVVEESIRACGIHVIKEFSGLDGISRTDIGLQLAFTRDGETEVISADAVVLTTGWPGNGDSLGLEMAGVAVERGYVVVDDYLRTTAEHIYAAGDITGKMMLVQSAGYEARIAAENAVLGPSRFYTHQLVPHGGFTDPEYASVGLTEDQARLQERDCLTAVVPYRDLDRAVIDGHTVGFCKLIVSRETHRVLGAHIVGEQALEVAQMVAAGMSADVWVEQLAELEIAYPTYTAIVGLAARQIVYDLGIPRLAVHWRELGKSKATEWERSWS